MTAVLDKPQLKRRFRTRHVDDKTRTTASRSGIKIPFPTTDGSVFSIDFNSVGKEKDPFQNAYCAYEVSEDATIPNTVKKEEFRGMKIVDYLRKHDEFICGTIYEDLAFYRDQTNTSKETLEKEMSSIEAEIAKKKAELNNLSEAKPVTKEKK